MRYLNLAASFVFAMCMGNTGCDADSSEHSAVDSQQSIYVSNQPIPTFQWSLERHLLVQLYQARNQSVATYSYVVNQYTGRIQWRCTSLGFPIPATTQLTNPMRVAYQNAVIPQPEPNGVYAPRQPRERGCCARATTATWSPCTWRSTCARTPAPWRSTTANWCPSRARHPPSTSTPARAVRCRSCPDPRPKAVTLALGRDHRPTRTRQSVNVEAGMVNARPTFVSVNAGIDVSCVLGLITPATYVRRFTGGAITHRGGLRRVPDQNGRHGCRTTHRSSNGKTLT